MQMIDWQVVATLAAPVIALFAGAAINRWLESRPTLVSYYSHISAFTVRPKDANPFTIHTHSVVLRNTGRQPATNVRIRHVVLPEFNIWPHVIYSVEELPEGGHEIVVPTLVPGEEITISYMYAPPLTAVGVNAGIRSDKGFATEIPVLIQRQYPKWVARLVAVLILSGAVAILYLAFLAIRWVV